MSSHTSPDASKESIPMVLRVLSQERSRKSPSSPQHNEQPEQDGQYETEGTSRVCEECQQIDFSKVFELDLGASSNRGEKRNIYRAARRTDQRAPWQRLCSMYPILQGSDASCSRLSCINIRAPCLLVLTVYTSGQVPSEN